MKNTTIGTKRLAKTFGPEYKGTTNGVYIAKRYGDRYGIVVDVDFSKSKVIEMSDNTHYSVLKNHKGELVAVNCHLYQLN